MDMLTKDITFWIVEFATGMISKDYLMHQIRRIVAQETGQDCESDIPDDW